MFVMFYEILCSMFINEIKNIFYIIIINKIKLNTSILIVRKHDKIQRLDLELLKINVKIE